MMYITKIVINTTYGGFSLSEKAIEMYCKLKNIEVDAYYNETIERNDNDLITIVEQLGEEANGRYAKLKIVKIPNDIDWYIGWNDGIEWVAEEHRMWY